jgi:hypothetical protein
VQRLLAVLALMAGLVTTVQAQQQWHSEFGISSGYSRIKPAGTGASDYIDVFGIPSFSLAGVIPGGASLFGIVPVKNKVAIELSASALQGNAILPGLIGDATFFSLDARVDYALTRNVYGAAGAAFNFLENGGLHETQLGVEAALGYRFGFIVGLRGRIEANAVFLHKTNLVDPRTVYALEFGVSKQIGAHGRSTVPVRATNRAWRSQLGIQGGYTRAHVIGADLDLTALSIPGFGGVVTLFGSPAAPPILFAILPVGSKFAIEPGLDISRVQTGGMTEVSTNASARLNYAVGHGWYGAAGGNLQYFKVTGSSGETVTGANVAWGYRFPLAGGLGGRFEIDYTMMGKNTDLALPPTNTLGLLFGVTMALQ